MRDNEFEQSHILSKIRSLDEISQKIDIYTGELNRLIAMPPVDLSYLHRNENGSLVVPPELLARYQTDQSRYYDWMNLQDQLKEKIHRQKAAIRRLEWANRASTPDMDARIYEMDRHLYLFAFDEYDRPLALLCREHPSQHILEAHRHLAEKNRISLEQSLNSAFCLTFDTLVWGIGDVEFEHTEEDRKNKNAAVIQNLLAEQTEDSETIYEQLKSSKNAVCVADALGFYAERMSDYAKEVLKPRKCYFITNRRNSAPKYSIVESRSDFMAIRLYEKYHGFYHALTQDGKHIADLPNCDTFFWEERWNRYIREENPFCLELLKQGPADVIREEPAKAGITITALEEGLDEWVKE